MKSIFRLRSQLFAVVLLLFHTPLCGRAQKSKTPAALADLQFASGQSARQIPFHFVENLLYLRGRANDSKPLWLLLDTGATSYFDAKQAKALRPGVQGKSSKSATSKPSTLVLSRCTLPSLDEQVLCGGLDVFENRDAGAGRIIRLRVAVLPAHEGSPRTDPVFIIVGGPGQSAVDNAAGYAALLAPLRTDRTLVFVDQRGTGASNPLPCDLYSAQPSGLLGDFMPLHAVRACRNTLERTADLRYYSSALAADDLDDVRRALGYEQINIEAASYGTCVALLYLRRYSAHVRSAVLRSVSH